MSFSVLLGTFFSSFFALLLSLVPLAARGGEQVHVRATLLQPANTSWKVQVAVYPSYNNNTVFVVGRSRSAEQTNRYYGAPSADVLQGWEKSVEALSPGQSTPWIDLSAMLTSYEIGTVRFLFLPADPLERTGVKARIEVATAPDEKAIVRAITEHDPANIVSLRVPYDLTKDKQWLLSIREDAERRLKQVRDLKLPRGPLPKKVWLMTGFRPWWMFTDPAITALDFQVIHELGMNGYWEFTAETWKIAPKYGIDRTTVFWRDAGRGLVTKLDWAELAKFVDDSYRRDIDAAHKIFGDKLPPAVVDLMDEPAGVNFAEPEYSAEFARFAQDRGFTPEFFGKTAWKEVKAIRSDAPYFWWDFFKTRKALDTADLFNRRLFYWSTYFLAHANARIYGMATSAIEKYAPETLGTRVNAGPFWWYDYGTIPRGIDQFEMARLRGITIPFNEDWIGSGDPRWPLETTALLADWDRAPFRPDAPIGGGYITRDANRTSLKLRVFGFLARDCKIFDFYYYGPAYGHFDHWSDNLSMVQGVAELSRDIGRADDILWSSHPPKAEVALLYSKPWRVWMDDDTELIEFMMTYLALLHAHVPVDIVSDEEVADGRFATGGYKCLYVVNESVPAKTAVAIEQWVKSGGHLWAAGWAAARDEYNTPSDAWNKMLGVRERSWKPTGDLKRLGELINYADERRPYFSRACRLVPEAGGEVPGATYVGKGVPAPDADQTARACRQPYGEGVVQVVPWTAGKDYLDGHRKTDGPVGKDASIIYPSDGRRAIFADFARELVQPPTETSVSQILAWPLWSENQGVVLIANYTGSPAEKVKVSFRAPMKVKRVESLRAGRLRMRQAEGGAVECTLPVRDVTDILIIND